MIFRNENAELNIKSNVFIVSEKLKGIKQFRKRDREKMRIIESPDFYVYAHSFISWGHQAVSARRTMWINIKNDRHEDQKINSIMNKSWSKIDLRNNWNLFKIILMHVLGAISIQLGMIVIEQKIQSRWIWLQCFASNK